MTPFGPQSIPLAANRLTGELARRALRNFDRMEEEKYQPDKVFIGEQGSGGWPGDTEGRTVLALTLLTQATGRAPKYLAEILRKFPAETNERGYFGTIHPAGTLNEQQLSSHGWVLRALCEEFLRTGDDAVRGMIERIVDNLVLPTAGMHRTYPIDPAERRDAGEHAGTTQGTLHGWQVSSDIGCDFIFMDGVEQAWEVLQPGPRAAALRPIIDEMVARFLEIDLEAIKAQTHATLTALRVLLRYAETAGKTELVAEAARRFASYRGAAWTANYANYNWFGRPQWTEPCAVVDSFMVAVGLWRATGEAAYLADAQRIYYAGLGHGQRANGGFGCDTCAGAAEPFIKVSVPEAHWCCTMRGGEGLARAIQYGYFTADMPRPTVWVPFFHDGRATLPLQAGALTLKQTTLYPRAGDVRLAVEANAAGVVAVKLFVPPWAEQWALRVNDDEVDAAIEDGFVTAERAWQAGDVITLRFSLKVQRVAPVNHNNLQEYEALCVGPLMLGHDGSEEVRIPAGAEFEALADGSYRIAGTATVLRPINDVIDRPDVTEQKDTYVRQVVFRQ